MCRFRRVLIGVYPGSFNPVTIAHLAIADAAHEQCGLDRLDLVISRSTLGKVDRDLVRIRDRIHVLETIARSRPWLGVRISDASFIVDLATGYDVVVLGADKWAQVADPAWYGGSTERRDEALARLPTIACAPRPPLPVPPSAVVLDVHPEHHPVSATDARAGRREWMCPEAVAFDDRTGAWSDPERYARWVAGEEAD